MAVMLSRFRVPLSWPELLRRTFDEAFFKDNCLGMSAQLAYYFFFALFPALLVILGVASYLYTDPDFLQNLFLILGGFVPTEGLRIITDQLAKTRDNQAGLVTLGMLTALWSSSTAMTAIIDTLNSAYDVPEGRPWWRVWLTAILLTIGLAAFVAISFTLVLAGPTLAESLARWFSLGSVFEWAWKILQWPLIFLLVSIGIALVYYFAPDTKQDWVWLAPGSIAATALWLLASLGFKLYVTTIGSYAAYGVVGGVMVLLLWFYISGLVILVGAELNAEIEHSSPYGKDRGEKVAGEKSKLPPPAMRAWRRQRQKSGQRPPSADEVQAVVGSPPTDLKPGTPLSEQEERQRAADKGIRRPPIH